jgi:uncharacterized protein (DUF1778 family)
MEFETRRTDARGRVSLPRAFANATVIIERVSDNELRVRKARVIAEDEIPFVEESVEALSNRDRDRFLQLLEKPPRPSPSLRRAAERYRKRHR